jgi:hypothetical protein
LRVDSPGGVIALLPLLERTMPQVAAELGVASLVGHDLGFDRVLDTALGFGGSGHWASCAVAWFEGGFPAAGHREGLRLVMSDKSVPQQARQTAARILTRTTGA